jgi:hypothetical protein
LVSEAATMVSVAGVIVSLLAVLTEEKVPSLVYA